MAVALANHACVTKLGAVNIATQNFAIHAATNMANARTVLAYALPVGMGSIVQWKDVRRVVRRMVNVE